MLDTEEARSHAALMDLVRQLLEQATGVEAHTLYNDAPFHEIGLTSLAILNFNELIQPLFADLNKTLLFDCRCIRDVATHLLREHPQASASYLPVPYTHLTLPTKTPMHLTVVPLTLKN
ncbi:hypothetical protein MF6396_24350, partial [Pseudomonas sp. MF6396]|uniref:acyl carrier protein n=1 Tax=Pseudomonas sp. MF6396 TaxID=1960828 RepID=UPI0009C4905D